jgi:peptide chain release factor 2
MGETDLWNNAERAQKIVADLKLIKAQIDPITAASAELDDAKVGYELAKEAGDADMLAEADKALFDLQATMQKIEQRSLLSGKHDHRNCFFTISAGDGGTEANDWTEMLFRMYLKFFDWHPEWKIEELSLQHAMEVGIDSVTLRVSGPFAYGYLACERGTHRLARVSPFNAQGKRQTSFATVDVTPEFEEVKFDIPPGELEVTYFARSSGPGGQNVNKVASACRVVHRPTGLQVVSSTYRDQPQNKAQALSILMSKLEEIDREKREREINEAKGGDVDRGWGTQIRSYVIYDNRVKDHRTGHEVGNPQYVLDGHLDEFIDAELKRKRREQSDSGKAGH